MDIKIKNAINEAKTKAKVSQMIEEGNNTWESWDKLASEIKGRKDEYNFVAKSNEVETIKKSFQRGGWQFLDVYKKEGNTYFFYAMPSEEKRPYDFSMVTAFIGEQLPDYKCEPRSPKEGASETEGIHMIAITRRN